MDERFISYIWFNKLFDSEQHTLLGERVKIISVGTPNGNAGPDVFNAKVDIDGRVWAGCVEFHVRASDWHRHRHDGNRDYERVILHVVLDADEQIMTADDSPVPTIALRFPSFMTDNYKRLTDLQEDALHIPDMPCLQALPQAETMALHSWIDRLLIERIEEKIDVITGILQRTGQNWEEAFYIMLCRAMGFGTNSDAMQSLALSIPLSAIAHHRDNIEQLEALLLGQARFLDNITPQCTTEEIWVREYSFLKNKFNLTQPAGPQFKLLRMRPPGFPTMRIAQTAAILHSNEHLLRRVLECKEIAELRKIFSCSASDYWTTHYTVGNTTTKHSAALSQSSVDILIINTVVPFIFLYGKAIGNYDLQEHATDLLRSLPPERNNLIDKYTSAGIECRNAYDSQALLRLHRHYCLRRDCLRCYFGSLSIRGSR